MELERRGNARRLPLDQWPEGPPKCWPMPFGDRAYALISVDPPPETLTTADGEAGVIIIPRTQNYVERTVEGVGTVLAISAGPITRTKMPDDQKAAGKRHKDPFLSPSTEAIINPGDRVTFKRYQLTGCASVGAGYETDGLSWMFIAVADLVGLVDAEE